MPRAWRLVKTRHLAEAMTGEGARHHGGRWNSPGVRVVYAAESLALSALELLVQLGSTGGRAGYSAIPIDIQGDDISWLDETSLPRNWRESPPPAGVRSVGDSWVRSGASLVLGVPSVVIPKEKNYLINPLHPAFPAVVAGVPEPFEFDPRLIP